MIDAPTVLQRADSNLVDALHPSPNFEPRRGGKRPDILLLHYTGMKSASRAIDWLSRPESRVSCHYVLDIDGAITQMVSEEKRAWHAGAAVWCGETDINSLSIGIEIQNPGHDDGYPGFPEPQMRRLEDLCLDIMRRWAILPKRVLAHSDVAPKRKIDPGEKFDWARLAERGICHWVAPVPVDPTDAGLEVDTASHLVAAAQRLLAAYGFGVPSTAILDAETRTVIAAFQRHFRPARIDGRLDLSTLSTLERLCADIA